MSVFQAAPAHGHVHGSRQKQVEYVRELARFVLTEPYMCFCIRQISNDCLTHPIEIRENGRQLRPELQRLLSTHFTEFADKSLSMLYMCGFVAYYVKKVDGVRLPHVLPLGSFTWCIKRLDNPGSAVWPFEIRLDGIDVSFDKHKIHIFDCMQSPSVYSPVDSLFELFMLYKNCRQAATESTEQLSRAHIVVTETVDLKDQTISGLQLLDETRRYAMSGLHPLAQTDVELRPEQYPDSNVTGMKETWIHRMNEQHPELRVSILPPNSQITQVAVATPDVTVLQEFFNQYIEGVLSFFNIQHRMSTGQFRVQSAQPNSNMKNQYNNVLATSKRLEHLLREVYSVCFELELQSVSVKLTPQKKLEVSCVADLKILAEWNVFTVAQMRDMF
jgi:hypothetical protein